MSVGTAISPPVPSIPSIKTMALMPKSIKHRGGLTKEGYDFFHNDLPFHVVLNFYISSPFPAAEKADIDKIKFPFNIIDVSKVRGY